MRARHIAGTVVVAVIALGIGYVIGFRSAWQMGVQAEFAARGVLATQMLQAMERGRTEFVTTILEGDVDSALLIGGDFIESLARPLLPMLGVSSSANHEDFISRVARYRKENPRQVSSSDPEMKRAISERVDRYAK